VPHERADQPVEPADLRVAVGAGRAAVGLRLSQHAAGQPGRAREELLALRLGQREQDGVEELADDAEGDVRLELGAARGEDARRELVRRVPADRPQQTRLADPGGALHYDEPPLARDRLPGGRRQRRELSIPFDERVRSRCGDRGRFSQSRRPAAEKPGLSTGWRPVARVRRRP
jgi:hypothetical protein